MQVEPQVWHFICMSQAKKIQMGKRFSDVERKARLEHLKNDSVPKLIYDDVDEEALCKLTWCLHVDQKGYKTLRAKESVGGSGFVRPIKMHQFIMQRKLGGQLWLPYILEVMHRDHNIMNVCRDNLTLGRHADNGAKGKTKNTSAKSTHL